METLTCAACDHAAVHGWWGPDVKGTHCRDCHRTWPSLTECHCASCHQQFSAPSVFGAHAPYCGPDAPERLREAVAKDGTTLFATRQRRGGTVWISYDPRQHWLT